MHACLCKDEHGSSNTANLERGGQADKVENDRVTSRVTMETLKEDNTRRQKY
jgi:hypothetical protein